MKALTAASMPARVAEPMLAAALFLGLTTLFALAIGRSPMGLLGEVATSAAGSGYAIGESLLRATPILLCALATLLPARAGLVSVGAEGQLYLGALAGTGALLALPAGTPSALLLPATLTAGALGGAAWALGPALLRATARVNETLSTLLLNYVAALLVTWLVYGPWKNPQSQGWPASIDFPLTAQLPTFGDSRVHAGLLAGLAAAVVIGLVLGRSRWGLVLDVLRSNPRVASIAGIDARRQIVVAMLVGGALAGLAGIAETSSVQGRLQAGFANGAGLSGFLVAWLAGQRPGRAVVWSLVVGAMLAAGDGLQMAAQVPSSATLVLQGLLFVAVLGGTGWARRRASGGARR